MTSFVYIIEIIGTIAFAVSGAMVGAEKKMDIFGVMVLGVTTAVGGGMLRDLMLGATPPAMFRDSSYVCVAVIASLIVFITMYLQKDLIKKHTKLIDSLLNIFDAIGLGIFVIAGVNTAAVNGFFHMAFLSIFVGVITGIGGGILRDIFAGRIPVVLHKRVYAVAAILGAAGYYYTRQYFVSNDVAMAVGITLTISIRMLATYFEWSLPKLQ